MRALWFVNSPPQTAKQTNAVGQGWIGSLESELTKINDIELGIVFKSGNSKEPFLAKKNITYFPVPVKKIKGKLGNFFHRWSHQIEMEEYLPEYLKIINTFKPDVIHLFGTESDYGLVIPQTSVPSIIHIQGNLTVYKHKWYSGLTRADITKYSNKSALLRGHGFFHDHFIATKEANRESKIFNGCKYFMGRTDWDRRLCAVLSTKSHYFHCDEILRQEFYLHEWQPRLTPHTDYTIITVIRRNIYKGLETIYECKKILNQKFPGLTITWKIAGLSEKDEIVKLIERKYKNKLENLQINLLGPLQEKELVDKMLDSDLYVHPSHIENSPNGVCEAMLLGLPVIATNAGGTPSLLEDKKEGLLIQDGDPYVLSGSIIELLKDKNYSIALGTNARKRALTRHDKNKIVKDLLSIYSSIKN